MSPRQLWLPLGQLAAPPLDLGWAASHAGYPTALIMDDRAGLVRIYFSPRDPLGRSHLACMDIALDATRVERIGPICGPLLSPGPRGAFDADGVTLTSVVRDGPGYLGYYLGWSLGRSVPFSNFIGLATSPDGTIFQRSCEAPIVGRSAENPLSLGYPFVFRDGDSWQMLFGSHLSWGPEGMDMQHVLKRAVSADGRRWTPCPGVELALAGASDPAEFALSRPVLLSKGQRSLMWYARKAPNYRLGFAVRDGDGPWQRRDQAVTFIGEAQPWEDQERTYPCVFECRGGTYMLYNGNGYGATGFGLALLTNPEAIAG
jgi:hypothetical protein